MQKKYQIFVSSTFRDLVDERQDTIRSILDLGHIPAGMEIFPAVDQEQFAYITKVIDECDYYLLIVGGRYGSVDQAGISFTEKEYKYALEKGIPVLAFVHGDLGSIPTSKSDTVPKIVEQLKSFRDQVTSGRLVKFWTTRDDLKANVIISLAKTVGEFPREGWIRASVAANEDILAQINTLQKKNDELKIINAALKAELSPSLENVAGLDETYTVRFHYYNDRNEQREGTATLTWRAIFCAVGPSYQRPQPPNALGSALKSYLLDKKFARSVYEVLDSEKNQIKIQLLALGLIRTENAQSVGAGVQEYLQLTKRGEAVLLESMAIRSKVQ